MTTSLDTSASEPADADSAESTTSAEPDSAPARTTATPGRSLSISVRSLAIAAVIVLLLAATGTFAGLWLSQRSEAASAESAAADTERAEQIALDYAVGAATTDYRDLSAWFDRLKENTSTSLAQKFDATAPQLQQILVPLNWQSNATPIAAMVSSHAGSIYEVDAFVSVSSTSKQAPNGATTTVTYSVTVDSADDWKVTDVGGLDGVLPN